MNYATFIDELQNLINRKVTHSEIAEVLNCGRANISKKVNTPTSEVTVTDLFKIQEFYNVIFPQFSLQNTLQPKDNEQVLKNFEHFGARLNEIQGELGYLDKAMARIMGIDEKRYMRIKLGKEDATAEQLAWLASKVDVSLDWLIKGE